MGLAEARRCAAEVIEPVERGRNPVADERVHKAARDALTFTDLVEDHLADIAKRRGSKHLRDVKYALYDLARATTWAYAPQGHHPRRRGCGLRSGAQAIAEPYLNSGHPFAVR